MLNSPSVYRYDLLEKTTAELLKVKTSSLPPVPTLCHLIDKRSPILPLVGKHVLITHILKDIIFGTSDYNSEWS